MHALKYLYIIFICFKKDDWGDILPNPDHPFSLEIVEQPINYDQYFNVGEYLGTYYKLLFPVSFIHILQEHPVARSF